jgi:ATP-dependent phosphoenolpyruvate carboxykinase
MRIEETCFQGRTALTNQNPVFSPCFDALFLPEPASISLETLPGG